MPTTASLPGAYSELFSYAQAAAEKLTGSGNPPRCARALRMCAAALAILRYPRVSAARPTIRTAAHEALDEIVANWPDLARGAIDGEEIMRLRPDLWSRLMTEWPMMGYADALIQCLQGQPSDGGGVLEVGCGVGNTTQRLAALFGPRLTWSDANPMLVRRGRWAGTGVVFDFDAAAPAGFGPFETVVATNALHCAAHLDRTLRTLRDLLVPGGLLMIAEGTSPTRDDGRPWALDLLFCAFDGWWDRGGFRTHEEWTAALGAQGFTGIGHAGLDEGPDRVGAVFWARRAAEPS